LDVRGGCPRWSPFGRSVPPLPAGNRDLLLYRSHGARSALLHVGVNPPSKRSRRVGQFGPSRPAKLAGLSSVVSVLPTSRPQGRDSPALHPDPGGGGGRRNGAAMPTYSSSSIFKPAPRAVGTRWAARRQDPWSGVELRQPRLEKDLPLLEGSATDCPLVLQLILRAAAFQLQIDLHALRQGCRPCCSLKPPPSFASEAWKISGREAGPPSAPRELRGVRARAWRPAS